MDNNTVLTETKSNVKTTQGVKFKLILSMVLIVVIPLLISITISFLNSIEKAKTDAETINVKQAEIVASAFSDNLYQQLRTLESAASSPYTIEFVKKADALTDEDKARMISFLDNLNVPYNDGNSIVITASTGDQLARTGDGALSNISDRDYFKSAIAGQSVISDMVISKATGSRIIIPAVPVYDDDYKTPIGTAQRSYDLSTLHSLLKNNIEQSQRAFITDSKGIVIAHSDYEIGPDDPDDNRSDRKFFTLASQNGKGTYISDDKGSEKQIVSYYKDPLTNWVVIVSSNYDAVMSSAYRSAILVIIIAVIMTIIAIFMSFAMAKSFTGPMQEVNAALHHLADGQFLTINKYTDRKDEFGEMIENTNSVLSVLGKIVTSIKESAVAVNGSSVDLADAANQISQTAEDVSNAVQEIASGATQQADEIQSATENVGRIGEAIADVRTSSDDLSDIAGKMKEASEISSNSLRSLQNSSTEMTTKIDDISQTIQATKDAVNTISEKVEGITSIATQTNLLSLNASIEAARAGEAGKGFAVVAEEIGKLAEDSKQMADDIKLEMEHLLSQSNAAVAAAADVKQGNNDQQIALGETLDAVNGMLEDISNTVSGVKLISNGAETCDNSKNAVVDTMSALSAISEENAASSEETGASMQELSATVTTLAGSADKLKQISEKLSADIDFFK